MADTRRKDVDWTIQNPGEPITWYGLQAAVLMDLRDELKRLNSLLYCRNFTDMPRTLREIRRNTFKPRPRVHRASLHRAAVRRARRMA